MTTNQKAPSTSTLPSDIFYLIFNLLHAAVARRLHHEWTNNTLRSSVTTALYQLLCTLCTVDRKWRSMAISFPSLWTVIPLIDKFDFPFSLEEFAQRSSSHNMTLLFALDHYAQSDKFRRLQSLGVIDRVTRMDMALDPVHGIQPTRRSSLHIPSLQHVRFCHGAWLSWANEREWLGTHCEQLVSFELSSITIRLSLLTSPFTFSQLKEARLDQNWNNLQFLGTQSFPVLTKLRLGASTMPDLSQQPLRFPKPFNCLKELIVEGGRFDNGLEHVLTASPNLEYIEFKPDDRASVDLLAFKLARRSVVVAPFLRELMVCGGHAVRLHLEQLVNARWNQVPRRLERIILVDVVLHFDRDTEREPRDAFKQCVQIRTSGGGL